MLTKHRRNRNRIKKILEEADKWCAPNLDHRICILRMESTRKRIKKALEILEDGDDD